MDLKLVELARAEVERRFQKATSEAPRERAAIR